jgi:ribosome-binding protein aMBF1 (putative translation factor)
MTKIPKPFYHKCKICGEETTVRFNIDFNEVFICEGCAVAITTQQVVWYSKTYLKDDDGLYISRKDKGVVQDV